MILIKAQYKNFSQLVWAYLKLINPQSIISDVLKSLSQILHNLADIHGWQLSCHTDHQQGEHHKDTPCSH